MGQPILLVEDSPEDAEATCRALRRAGLAAPIVQCSTGDEALDFLRRRGEYAEPGRALRPGIILLDLNLPGTDGREVLQEIKRDADLCQIPVVVLTTSGAPQDVEACYRAGANSYIQKPVDLDGLLTAVQRLKDYWFDVVILPKPKATHDPGAVEHSDR
jgi:CheY-like chemotaxis protein